MNAITCWVENGQVDLELVLSYRAELESQLVNVVGGPVEKCVA
jgi:hypothetical protein